MKLSIKPLALTCALLTSLPAAAWAETFYVTPDGYDGRAGTSWDSAFGTIRRAALAAGPGDTVVVGDGEYRQGVIDLDRDGAPGAPITFEADNVGRAKIVGALRTTGDHLVVRGFDVTNPGPEYGISTYENHHVTIQNNTVHNSGGGGIGSTRSDRVTIENNTTFGNAARNLDQHSGISVFQPVDKRSDLPGDGAFGIVVRNNTSYDNYTIDSRDGNRTDGNGIILDDFDHTQASPYPAYVKGALVENNVCRTNGGAGIHVFYSGRGGNGLNMPGIVIRHNTCHNNGRAVAYDTAEISLDRATGVRVYNNVLSSVGAGDNRVAAYQNASGDVIWEHNVLFREAGHGAAATKGTNLGAGNRWDQPRFVDEFDLRLAAGSVGVDAAKWDPYAPWNDREGGARIEGAAPDIGAFEQ